MGMRFRKSVNLGGGTKVNVSKSGVGFSAGVKGARVTKTSRGTVRTTLSAPGTGLSYVSETGSGKHSTGRRSGSSSGEYDRLADSGVYELLDELEARKAAQPDAEATSEPKPLKFCPQCGAKIPADAMQCPSCKCRFDAPGRIADEDARWTAGDVADVAKMSARIILVLLMLFLSFIPHGLLRIAALILTVLSLPVPAIDRIMPLHGWKRGLVTFVLFFAIMIAGAGNAPEAPVETASTEAVTEAVTEATTEEVTEAVTEAVPAATAAAASKEPKAAKMQYALNTDTGKFHRMNCSRVGSGSNWKKRYATRAAMIEQGYDPCGVCEP